MIDLHHDLLSILYYSYIRNDYSYVSSWIKNFHGDNVSGLLANLYFMNLDEMEKEVGYRDFDVIEMFKISTSLFHKYLPNTKVLFSIEGCDYIESIDQLEELYNLGLRNIILVWNNPNKYASGNRGRYGLTEEGKIFLRKAIDLGISIDLSHMNRQTFFDTIDFIKEERRNGKNPKVIASHSNCFSICKHLRNLDDDQLRALKSVDGLLGLVAYGGFTRDEGDSTDLKELFLEHVSHAVSIMGIDSVGISTDDMTFSKELFLEDFGEMVFDYSNVKSDLEELLTKKFSSEEIEKILYLNSYNKLFKE